MSEPDLSTLPKRMCYAAKVLEEVCKRYRYEHTDVPWQASTLRREAMEVEGEDQLVEELALDIHRADEHVLPDPLRWETFRDCYREVARMLIDAGWHK